MMKNKILIVEDELDIRIYVATILKANGYESISAKNGEKGLACAKKHKPDMILLDIMMPDRGGVWMYGKLKDDPELNTTPVCMLTGVGKTSFEHYLKMTGMKRPEKLPPPEAYLEKPFEPADLTDIIQRILSKKPGNIQ